jgi:uncharacterized protein (DUF1684 family)
MVDASPSANLPGRISLRPVCLVVAVIVAAGLLTACDDRSSEKSYTDRITNERVSRDMEMRGDRSVIPAKQRKSFRGLEYYDIDSTYRFVRPVDRRPRPDTVMMAESTGGVAAQVRVGTVSINFPQQADTLTVFEVTEGEDRGQWWIPFTDATNGGPTYRLGRYVDLERAGTDSVIVDFNTAYNPTCAYNPRYACPIPPDANALPFDVPVGEKKPVF